MSEPINNPIEELANELVDSLRLDWKKADTLNDEEKLLLKNLNTISQVAQLHESQNNRQAKPKDAVSVDSLFNWGRLAVIEKIGQGSFGQVYRAHDAMLERDVALKLLKDDKSSPLQSKTFIEEAKRLAKVRHPNVLAIHGAAIHEGRSGFWSDLIVGKPLNHNEQTQFDDSALIKVISQVAQGLNAIHQAGIIHGDIKPANIIEDQRGDYLIMDFGAGMSLTEVDHLSGYIHGTPALMAPELFAEKHTGTATDIYAFGATLFKICTGQYPVTGQDLLEIQNAHQQKRYASIHSLRPDLDKDLSALIQSMVAVDANERTHSDQIIRSLYDIETAPQRRKNKRNALAIMALLVAGTAASTYGFYQANQEKEKALVAQNKAETVNEFLQDMLSASAELGGGREVRVADVLDQASEKLNNEPPEQLSIAHEMHLSLAKSYNALRQVDKGINHAEKSVNLAQSIDVKNTEPFVDSQLALVAALENGKKHEESLALATQIVNDAEAKLGSDHWYIQLARKFQITNLFSLSKYDEAIAILDNHFKQIPDPKTASNNFGFQLLQAKSNAYYVKGEFAESVEAAKQGIAWLNAYPHKNLMNEEGIYTALGLSQLELGQLAEGVQALEKVLELNEQIYGVENQEYVDALVNLGAAQRLNKQAELAKETTLKAYELAKKVYGDEDNIVTVGIGTNLANMLVDLGDVKQGESIMRESLSMAYGVLGEDKPQSLILEYNLAELLHKQGEFAEAAEMASKTYAKKITAFGENHPYVFLSLDNWAICLSGLGKHEEAIEKHQQAVSGISAAMGADHQYALLVRQHQIDTLLNAKHEVLVIEKLPPLLEDMTKTLGAEDENTQKYHQLFNSLKN